MTHSASIARTPRESCRFPLHQAIAFDGLCALARLTGVWDPPPRASGDLEEMGFLDKAFWLYKSSRPVRRAERGSGLEAYFARPKPAALLPAAFAVSDELRLSAVGDLMPHPYLAGSAATLYPHVASAIFEVDLAMANLECVVAPRSEAVRISVDKGPVVGMDPAAFDVVATGPTRAYEFMAAACNHSLDLGEAGVASTVEALRGRGIAFHGVNDREEDAARATLLQRDGFRVAVVAHTFGLNAYRPPEHRPTIVNRTRLNAHVDEIDFSLLRAQLAHAAAERADFTIVQLHWGLEFELYPRPAQLAVAHRIAELGADLIVGHHPHVVQPMELYRTQRDADRYVPIYYSLGNLTNPFAMPWMSRSAIARVRLARGRRPGGATKTYVREASTIEVDQHADDAARTLSLRLAPLVASAR